MTDLERFAAALLAQWRTDGHSVQEPIPVSEMLDRVLPYRVARRTLGIDVSEDYEALALRLIAEEQGLAHIDPPDAGELARATLATKLPDLDTLKLLRSASITLSDDAIESLDGVLPMPVSHDESKWAPEEVRHVDAPPPDNSDVLHLPVSPAVLEAVAAVTAMANEPPAEFMTSVSFIPPVEQSCWSCSEVLPGNRTIKFCPFCGADQRQPTCAACSAPVERRWKHCPECGTHLWADRS